MGGWEPREIGISWVNIWLNLIFIMSINLKIRAKYTLLIFCVLLVFYGLVAHWTISKGSGVFCFVFLFLLDQQTSCDDLFDVESGKMYSFSIKVWHISAFSSLASNVAFVSCSRSLIMDFKQLVFMSLLYIITT